jgi:hypothetical protein
VQQVLLAQLVFADLPVPLVLKVLQEQQDHRALPAQQVLAEQAAELVQQALQVLQVQPVQLVFRVEQAQRVLEVVLDQQAR